MVLSVHLFFRLTHVIVINLSNYESLLDLTKPQLNKHINLTSLIHCLSRIPFISALISVE